MLVAVMSLSATGGHGDENEVPFDIRIERYSGLADGPDAVRRKVRDFESVFDFEEYFDTAVPLDRVPREGFEPDPVEKPA